MIYRFAARAECFFVCLRTFTLAAPLVLTKADWQLVGAVFEVTIMSVEGNIYSLLPLFLVSNISCGKIYSSI